MKQSSDRKLFSYISFFSGGGGSSCGYKLAGGDCRFVNEFQQVAMDDYLANWPGTPNICDDIKNVTGKQIMEMTGLKVGELYLMVVHLVHHSQCLVQNKKVGVKRKLHMV